MEKTPGKFLVLDTDQLAGGLGRGFVDGADRGHALAVEAHFLDGQRRFLARLGHPAPSPAVEVLAGQYALDALHPERFAGVDAEDAGVRMRAAQQLDPEHAGKIEVGGVARIARHLLTRIDARQALAEQRAGLFQVRLFRRVHGCSPRWARSSSAAAATESKILV
jgi:hypothetical protein